MSSIKDVSMVDHKQCTGCGACESICPSSAIIMKYSADGFLYPEIDKAMCIHCGKCIQVCNINKPISGQKISRLSVFQYSNTEDLHRSASGGVFFGLAAWILSQGGYVVGCILDENCLPMHICTNRIEDVRLMQGSKYVQSRIEKKEYQKIKDLLENGKTILFSGTPCQVVGLKNYLLKEYEKLYTIDLICHGVASPGVYLNYIHRIEDKLGEKVNSVLFRDKSFAKYPNNHTIIMNTEHKSYRKHGLSDPYGSCFYHNRILRESCYSCKYANSERCGDLTIGDFGELAKLPDNEFPSSDGFSVVSINTDKGEKILENTKNQFKVWQIDYSYSQINLEKPTHRPADRDKVYRMHFNRDRIDGGTGIDLKITLSDRIKRLFPQSIKDRIKKAINW